MKAYTKIGREHLINKCDEKISQILEARKDLSREEKHKLHDRADGIRNSLRSRSWFWRFIKGYEKSWIDLSDEELVRKNMIALCCVMGDYKFHMKYGNCSPSKDLYDDQLKVCKLVKNMAKVSVQHHVEVSAEACKSIFDKN